MGQARQRNLLTASQVARYCQVDLKTIHNWADRGEISHFRTPGRHLRFRRTDVLEFLKRYGYPIPPDLSTDRPRVLVLDSDEVHGARVKQLLDPFFEVSVSSNPVSALVTLGAAAPDALVLGEIRPLDADATLAAIKAHPATRNTRVVVIDGVGGGKRSGAKDDGAVRRTDLDGLRDALAQLFQVAPAS